MKNVFIEGILSYYASSMKSFKTIIGIMGMVLLCGCNNRYRHVILPIEKTKLLRVEDSVLIENNCAYDMTIYDSAIVLVNYCGRKFFSLFETGSLKPICSFGTKGKGPNEFQMPQRDRSAIAAEDSILRIYDANLVVTKEINMRSLLRDTAVLDIDGKNTCNALRYNKDISRLNDTLYTGILADAPQGPLAIYDTKNDQTSWGEYDLGFTMPAQANPYGVCYGFLCANPEKGIVARVYKYIDIIQLFSQEGRLVKSICFSEPQLPTLNAEGNWPESSAENYALGLFGTPERFFALRYTNPYSEIKSKTGTPLIVEFDWNGNLTAVYDCPRSITQFCVDETDKKIYGLSDMPDIEHTQLYRFSY